jgi:predicted DNA-binding protein (UPF0251 family)
MHWRTHGSIGIGSERWRTLPATSIESGNVWPVTNVTGGCAVPLFPQPASNPPQIEPGLPDALTRLSERQRVAVILVYALDCSFQEVADLMGIKKGTVQSYVGRGLGKLRRALGVMVDA